MILGILGRIKNLFRREPVKKTYVLKTTPKHLEKVPDYVMKELGMKDAIIVKQREEIEALKKEIKRLKEGQVTEAKVASQVLKEKTRMIKERVKNSIRVMFYKTPPPLLRLWDDRYIKVGNKYLRFLRGYEREKNKDKEVVNLILSEKRDSKEIFRKRTGLPWELLWEDPTRFVEHVLTGIVKIRLDSQGRYHPPKEIEMVNNPDPKVFKKIKEMEKEYEEEITKLRDELDRVYSELEKTRKREEKLRFRVRDLEMANSLNDYRADLNQAATLVALNKLKAMSKDYLTVLLSAQESEVNRVLTERLNEVLLDAIAEVREKLGKEVPQDLVDILREKIRAEFLETLDVLHEVAPRRVEITRETKPKETKKEGE